MKRFTLKAVANRFAICAVLLFANGALWAQNSSDSGYRGRVVRLSLVEGDVSIQHGPNDRWLDATINVPLEQGDRLWVGAQGRTEIEFDDGSYARLASNSVLEIQNLDLPSNGRYTQVFLSQGLAYFNINESYNDTFRVTTPSLAADANRAARFRLLVDDRNELIVFRGEVHVNSNAGDITVRSQELFGLAGNSNQYSLTAAPGNDGWDRWNFDRDSFLTRASSYHYLPSSTSYGAQELDRYGRWAYQSGYGYVWSPYDVGPDWVPYSYGRWGYYPTFGYTWVSYEPWGWLPFHYGGWSWIPGFGWAWSPGVSFAYWSPARVFFFHHGGFIGWVPFSPFDSFFGGGTFININAFRPRNFFVDRVVVVNNNTFINNVVTQQTVLRNREVLTQVTTSSNVQFAAQPQIQRTANSEVLRPASFASSSNARLVTDSKGWNREDGIRGTGERPSQNFRSAQAFAAPTNSGTNREVLGASASSGSFGNNKENFGRGGSVNAPANGGARSENMGRSPQSTPPERGGRGFSNSFNRTEGNSREMIQGPANRTPFAGNNDNFKGRTESPRSSEQFLAPAPRQDAPRQEARPNRETPQNRQDSKPEKSSPPPRNESRANGTESSQRNSWQESGRSFSSGRPSASYVPPARPESFMRNSDRPSYTPPPAPRNESRSNSWTPAPRENFSRPSYSAPTPQHYEAPRNESFRNEAPRYQAPKYEAPRYEVPHQTYSPPPMPRENFARPSYSAPHSSAPQAQSAPAPRFESRSGGGESVRSAPSGRRRE